MNGNSLSLDEKLAVLHLIRPNPEQLFLPKFGHRSEDTSDSNPVLKWLNILATLLAHSSPTPKQVCAVSAVVSMDEKKKVPKECKLVVAVNLEPDKQTISDVLHTTWAWMKDVQANGASKEKNLDLAVLIWTWLLPKTNNRLKNGLVKVEMKPKDAAGEPTEVTKGNIFDMLIDEAEKVKTLSEDQVNFLIVAQRLRDDIQALATLGVGVAAKRPDVFRSAVVAVHATIQLMLAATNTMTEFWVSHLESRLARRLRELPDVAKVLKMPTLMRCIKQLQKPYEPYHFLVGALNKPTFSSIVENATFDYDVLPAQPATKEEFSFDKHDFDRIREYLAATPSLIFTHIPVAQSTNTSNDFKQTALDRIMDGIRVHKLIHVQGVHCECVLLKHHLGELHGLHKLDSAHLPPSPPYPWFGCMKLSCFQCSLHLLSYQNVNYNLGFGQPAFTTGGCHNEVYLCTIPFHSPKLPIEEMIELEMHCNLNDVVGRVIVDLAKRMHKELLDKEMYDSLPHYPGGRVMAGMEELEKWLKKEVDAILAARSTSITW